MHTTDTMERQFGITQAVQLIWTVEKEEEKSNCKYENKYNGEDIGYII